MSSRKRGAAGAPKQADAAVSTEGALRNGGADTEASSGGAGPPSGGGGGGSAQSPVAKRTRLVIAADHDPVPFECP